LLLIYWFRTGQSFPLFRRSGLELPFLFFSGAVLASFLTNWNTQTLALARFIELKWILSFYLLVALLFQVNARWPDLNKVQFMIGFCSLVAMLNPILGFDPLANLNHTDATGPGLIRVGGFFSNPMTFAHLYSLIFFLLAGVVVHQIQSKSKDVWISLLILILLGADLILSLTRGVWLGIFVGLVLMGFVIRRRWGYVVLSATIGLAAVLYFTVPVLQERVHQYTSADSYDGERLWIWKANWRMFLDHPWFGLGYGENAVALKDYYFKVGAPEGLLISHAHKQYLHILSGLGIFGLLAYLWMVLTLLIQTWRTYLRSRVALVPNWMRGLALGSLGAQVCFLVGGLTESNFEHAKVRYVLMLVWALPLWIQSQIDTQAKGVQS
jgi:O-antigen ligase